MTDYYGEDALYRALEAKCPNCQKRGWEGCDPECSAALLRAAIEATHQAS